MAKVKPLDFDTFSAVSSLLAGIFFTCILLLVQRSDKFEYEVELTLLISLSTNKSTLGKSGLKREVGVFMSFSGSSRAVP